jgi:predicted NAD-dependent protein-ADP-ribosyltransferase YbiA (DUF1768 family)
MNQNWRGASGAPLSVEALLREIEAGATPQYLFFWGHQAKSGETVGKHVLSQWWEAEFEIGAIRYPTAEHYMMAEKARMFGDGATLSLILEAPGPTRQDGLEPKSRPEKHASQKTSEENLANWFVRAKPRYSHTA